MPVNMSLRRLRSCHLNRWNKVSTSIAIDDNDINKKIGGFTRRLACYKEEFWLTILSIMDLRTVSIKKIIINRIFIICSYGQTICLIALIVLQN